jgi:hypothetical protein
MSRRKNVPIEWKVSELITWSEVPETFIMMVVTNGWLQNYYDADYTQRCRLMFVRKWWAANINEQALIKPKVKKRIFEELQYKLF